MQSLPWFFALLPAARLTQWNRSSRLTLLAGKLFASAEGVSG
jgi:hypothetical protein